MPTYDHLAVAWFGDEQTAEQARAAVFALLAGRGVTATVDVRSQRGLGFSPVVHLPGDPTDHFCFTDGGNEIVAYAGGTGDFVAIATGARFSLQEAKPEPGAAWYDR